ncbi:hypothetical protein BH10ACI2_BH10ACI2_06500 [soil metagenome]
MINMISATSSDRPAKQVSSEASHADRDLDLFSSLFSVPVAPPPFKMTFAKVTETDASIRVSQQVGSLAGKVAFVAEDAFPAFGQGSERNARILKSGPSVDAKFLDGSILEGFPFFKSAAEKTASGFKEVKNDKVGEMPDQAKLAEDGDILDLFKLAKTAKTVQPTFPTQNENIDTPTSKSESSVKAPAPTIMSAPPAHAITSASTAPTIMSAPSAPAITPASTAPTGQLTATEFQILEIPENLSAVTPVAGFEKAPRFNVQTGNTMTVQNGGTSALPFIANETKNTGDLPPVDLRGTSQKPVSDSGQFESDFLQLEIVDEAPPAVSAAARQDRSVSTEQIPEFSLGHVAGIATDTSKGSPLAELRKTERSIADRMATQTPLGKAEDLISSKPLATTFDSPQSAAPEHPKPLFTAGIKADDVAIQVPSNDLPLVEKITEPLRFTFSDDDGPLQNNEAENTGLRKKLDLDLSPIGTTFGSEIKLAGKAPTSPDAGNTKTTLNERILDQIEPRVIDLAALTPSGKEKRIMKMRLNPADMGTVEITLEKSASGTINAHFRTESHATQQILNESLVRLRESLETAGLQVGDLDTSCSGSTSSGSEHSDERPRQFTTSELPPVGIPSFDGISKSDDGLKDRLVNLRA